MAKRLKAMGNPSYENGFELTFHEKQLDAPLRMKKPKLIFVNSMSDLFHEDLPISCIEEVFNVMNKANWHIFQILTKRAEVLHSITSQFEWTDNIWMGVSIENNDYVYRAELLKTCPAKVKFLSLEPLLGPLPDLNLTGIDWVIVGGESGPNARPIDKSWVIEIRDMCLSQNVPFFFKQWGGVQKKKHGRELDGQIWDQMPKCAQNF
jgi:protein gp37